VVLSGAVTAGQLRSNLDGAALALPTGWVDSVVSDVEGPETYWRRRSERTWT